MHTPADKAGDNKLTAAAEQGGAQQVGTEQAFQLVDNRPQTVMQRGLQGMMNANLQRKQPPGLDAITRRNAQVTQSKAHGSHNGQIDGKVSTVDKGADAPLQMAKMSQENGLLVQRVSAVDGSSTVVQLVNENRDHHVAYLQAQVVGKDPSTDAAYAEALACAMVLDTHTYRVRDADERPQALDNILLQVPDFKFDLEPNAYHKTLRDYIAKQTGKAQDVLHWSPPATIAGFLVGTGMTAVFTSDRHPQGNPTEKPVPWMKKLSERRDGSGTLYVMGHLLNADLGGPSLDYNYVPLTGRAGFFGANGANRVHSELMEQIVKDKVLSIPDHGVTQVAYRVRANFGRAPRDTQINALTTALADMDTIAAEMETAGKPITKGQLMKLPKETKDALRAKVGEKNHLETGLNAVASHNYWTRSWATLKTLMGQNIALWRIEDAIVPATLDLHLGWDQDGTPMELNYNIPIDLPSAIGASYNGTLNTSGAGGDPMKHDQQFQQFLVKNFNPANATHSSVAGFLLDRQQYEVDIIAELMEEWGRLPQLRLEADDVATSPDDKERLELEIATIRQITFEYAMDIHGLRAILENGDKLAVLKAMVGGASGGGVMDMDVVQNAYESGLNLPRQSVIRWRGASPIKSFTMMEAQFAPNGHQEGSSAGGDNEWMSKLEQRRSPNGGKTVYVRGHMLNRHLGGPGLDYNMVPLTGNAGWFGANNANAVHSSGVEEQVKRLYDNMVAPDDAKSGGVTELLYRVNAVFGDHARPQTAQVVKAYTDLKAIEDELKQVKVDEMGAKSADELKVEFVRLGEIEIYNLITTNAAAGKRMVLYKLYEANSMKYGFGGDPTQPPLRDLLVTDFHITDNVQELLKLYAEQFMIPKLGGIKVGDARAMLSQASFRETWRTAVKDLDPSVIDKIKGKGLLETIMRASCGEDEYEELSLHSLGALLQANANLWQLEDHIVPLHLALYVKWKQDGQEQVRDVGVPNVLPSDVRAPYDPRLQDL